MNSTELLSQITIYKKKFLIYNNNRKENRYGINNNNGIKHFSKCDKCF